MKKNSLYDIEYFQKIKDARSIKNKKKRIRTLIIIIVVILSMIYLISDLSKINAIIVKGNERLSSKQILESINLKEKQFSFLHPKFLVQSQLEQTNQFKDVKVSKSLFGNVIIEVKEHHLLYYTNFDNKVVFYNELNNEVKLSENDTKIYMALVPNLVNKIDAKLQEKLINTLKKLDYVIVSEMSQIFYKPKNYDKEYFEIAMNASKKIYLHASLDHLVNVGDKYHNFASNAQYACNIIEYISSSNKAIVTKC